MYKITCPYCFETFDDTAVHFRSEYVSDENDNPLPDEYSDIEEFKANFRGSDEERQRIMREYEEWNFFREGEDKGWNGCLGYQGFWARFKDGNGTTEKNPEDDVLGVKAYHRRIINPYNPMHNKYLIYQGNDFFIRDSQGMVNQIVLKNGQSLISAGREIELKTGNDTGIKLSARDGDAISITTENNIKLSLTDNSIKLAADDANTLTFSDSAVKGMNNRMDCSNMQFKFAGNRFNAAGGHLESAIF